MPKTRYQAMKEAAEKRQRDLNAMRCIDETIEDIVDVDNNRAYQSFKISLTVPKEQANPLPERPIRHFLHFERPPAPTLVELVAAKPASQRTLGDLVTLGYFDK